MRDWPDSEPCWLVPLYAPQRNCCVRPLRTADPPGVRTPVHLKSPASHPPLTSNTLRPWFTLAFYPFAPGPPCTWPAVHLISHVPCTSLTLPATHLRYISYAARSQSTAHFVVTTLFKLSTALSVAIEHLGRHDLYGLNIGRLKLFTTLVPWTLQTLFALMSAIAPYAGRNTHHPKPRSWPVSTHILVILHIDLLCYWSSHSSTTLSVALPVVSLLHPLPCSYHALIHLISRLPHTSAAVRLIHRILHPP